MAIYLVYGMYVLSAVGVIVLIQLYRKVRAIIDVSQRVAHKTKSPVKSVDSLTTPETKAIVKYIRIAIFVGVFSAAMFFVALLIHKTI